MSIKYSFIIFRKRWMAQPHCRSVPFFMLYTRLNSFSKRAYQDSCSVLQPVSRKSDLIFGQTERIDPDECPCYIKNLLLHPRKLKNRQPVLTKRKSSLSWKKQYNSAYQWQKHRSSFGRVVSRKDMVGKDLNDIILEVSSL